MSTQKFSNEFKRQVVEEHLSGSVTAAQLMRRHDISSGSYTGKSIRQGALRQPATQEAALEERVRSSNSSSGSSPWRMIFKKSRSESLVTAKRSEIHC